MNQPPEPPSDRIPLGKPVPKPAPEAPEWAPKPGSPGIEVNRAGQMRTNLPLPKGFP